VEHVDPAKLVGGGWNEIVVDGRGNAYINGGCFGSAGGEKAGGVIVLVSADGRVREVADGIAFPNGMALGADGRDLIIAESHGKKLTAFGISSEGGLVNTSAMLLAADL
jgi:sugar lactone lactonase YvrE